MKLRCPSCQVILRLKTVNTGDKETARCPRCFADVSLKDDRFDVSAVSDVRLKVRCHGCGTNLSALESFVGTRSNCPKCHEDVLIERSSTVAAASEEGGFNAVGADTMAMRTPSLPKTDMDLDQFLDKPATSVASSDMSPVGGATGGLLNAPIDALTKAAWGIKESAETIGHHAPVDTHKGFGAENLADDAFDEHEEHHDTGGLDDSLEGEATPHSSQEEQTGIEHTPKRAGFPIGSGFLSGALAGSVVGGIWYLIAMFGGASVDTFLSPLPSWTGSWGVSSGVLMVAFPAVFGSLVGLLAMLSASSKDDAGPNFVRCVAWGLLGGLFMASMTITQPGDAFNQVAFSSALNWIRDFMLVGMLIPAIARLFGPAAA